MRGLGHGNGSNDVKAAGSNQGHRVDERSGRGNPAAAAGWEPLLNDLGDAVDSLRSQDPSAPWAASLTTGDRDRLAAVLGRRGGQATLDRSLAADLVEAVLPDLLAALVEGPTARRRLAERIASTLLDDPLAVARLQALVTVLSTNGVGSDGGTPRGSPS